MAGAWGAAGSDPVADIRAAMESYRRGYKPTISTSDHTTVYTGPYSTRTLPASRFVAVSADGATETYLGEVFTDFEAHGPTVMMRLAPGVSVRLERGRATPVVIAFEGLDVDSVAVPAVFWDDDDLEP